MLKCSDLINLGGGGGKAPMYAKYTEPGCLARRLLDAFREEVAKYEFEVMETPVRRYIGYKTMGPNGSLYNFANVRPRDGGLNIYLHILLVNLGAHGRRLEGDGLVRDVSYVGPANIGDLLLQPRTNAELRRVMPLVRKACDARFPEPVDDWLD